VISSPKSGEKHCLGDIIPIRWSAPKTAQSFILKVGWPSGSAQITSVAGNTAQFTSPVYYDYGWNQKSSAGISYTAGGGYYVSVTAHFKDGSSATARSVGVFVLAACPKTTS
ncbi:MAG: hypothetical protein KGH79_05195, partial [Patescibacteria group bacterium]|nr:hypothetical protein [Patescibacteria group bacterium]